MTTKVEKKVTVHLPVSKVYDQWTQFEDFPRFMSGVRSVTQQSDSRLHWVAQVGGVKRQWDATILEQVPDTKVAWAATQGATNAGAVYFEDLGGDQTAVRLVLEYEPEGWVERAGDRLGVVGRRAEGDLQRFKHFIEEHGHATGGWRGTVPGNAGTPGVEAATGTRGDKGKAGGSGKALATGATLIGVAAAASSVAPRGVLPEINVHRPHGLVPKVSVRKRTVVDYRPSWMVVALPALALLGLLPKLKGSGADQASGREHEAYPQHGTKRSSSTAPRGPQRWRTTPVAGPLADDQRGVVPPPPAR